MLKKVIAFATSFCVLVACLCISSGAVIYSDESNIPSGMDPITWQAIYEQLEAQDALDMLDEFVEIYKSTNPERLPYGSDDDTVNQYAPYGGTLEYTSKQGSVKIDVAITYLNRDDTLKFVLNQSQLKPGDVLASILGYIPLVGPLASTYSNVKAFLNSTTSASIDKAGGYTQIITTSRYDGAVTIASGWERYPYIYLYNTYAYDIKTSVLPEHDPWNL